VDAAAQGSAVRNVLYVNVVALHDAGPHSCEVVLCVCSVVPASISHNNVTGHAFLQQLS
jgi:deoxycytidine triphosphate deaminase